MGGTGRGLQQGSLFRDRSYEKGTRKGGRGERENQTSLLNKFLVSSKCSPGVGNIERTGKSPAIAHSQSVHRCSTAMWTEDSHSRMGCAAWEGSISSYISCPKLQLHSSEENRSERWQGRD